MTPEELRIAVAEAMNDVRFVVAPDDLNLCAEMVRRLDRLQLQKFYKHLQDVCAIRKEGKAPWHLQDYQLVHATAVQRCEAFIKTLHPQKAEVGE